MTIAPPPGLTPELWEWAQANRPAEEIERLVSLAKAEAERASRESDYDAWLKATFPQYVTAPLAEHHHQMWQWVWEMTAEDRPPALVAIINRGGAKSTTAEMACVGLGARGVRKYGWYVSRTQDQADDHVGNVGAMLESKEIAEAYPGMSEKLLGKFGDSKGWRRNRLRTASGFTVDALGLDSARRGGKLEEKRPDFIVIDDIDMAEDSPKVTRKLISQITKSIIPSGAENLAILAIQNLIHPNGLFARLASNKADYLRRRLLIGPIPALHNFAYEQNADFTYTITSGEPTWEGFGVKRCEDLLNEIGPKAFREECQHEVERVEGALWLQNQLDQMRIPKNAVPDMARIVVAVDPSGGHAEENDEQGIMVVGRGVDGYAYVLEDGSCKLSPNGWGSRALGLYDKHRADKIVGERNYGGEMVENTIKVLRSFVNYGEVNASRGKLLRAEPVAALYGDPARPDEWMVASKVRHVGDFPELEEEMRTWFEGCGWSPNRVDALVWALTELMLETPMEMAPMRDMRLRGRR